jgi:uncharacterized protein YqgV (UPF0045/DUF77 family)
MTGCTAEFFIEPFEEGAPGSHVMSGVAAMEAAGLSVSMGPFGSAVTGRLEEVSSALGAMVNAAVSDGAQRVRVEVMIEPS